MLPEAIDTATKALPQTPAGYELITLAIANAMLWQKMQSVTRELSALREKFERRPRRKTK